MDPVVISLLVPLSVAVAGAIGSIKHCKSACCEVDKEVIDDKQTLINKDVKKE